MNRGEPAAAGLDASVGPAPVSGPPEGCVVAAPKGKLHRWHTKKGRAVRRLLNPKKGGPR
jgi:hypothetical protein